MNALNSNLILTTVNPDLQPKTQKLEPPKIMHHI